MALATALAALLLLLPWSHTRAEGDGSCSRAGGEGGCDGAPSSGPDPECADDGRCALWLRPGDASNCSVMGSLLALHCPVTCGTCAAHAPFHKACAAGGAAPAGLVQAPADIERLCSAVERQARSLYGKVSLLSEKPWLLQIDDFLDPGEAQELAVVAESAKFHDGAYYTDTPEGGQRSSNTRFCEGDCEWDVRTVRVVEKTQALLNISAAHFEPIQFVQYRPGHYYRVHSDFVPEDVEAPHGPRLFTVFFYLRSPERGGETRFPEADLSVAPSLGRAVVWFNAGGFRGRKSFRFFPDSASQHESVDVLEGEKIGGNLWVHDRDYKTHRKYGCTR